MITLRGYVSVQRFYLYAEQGLSRRPVSIWLREGQLHIAYHDAILSRNAYRYDRKARRLQAVDTPRVFRTSYASPQLEFWELDDEPWHKIARRPYERRQAVAAWVADHPQVQLLWLPAYSGHKQNPVEKVWWRLKDQIAANRLHGSIDALVDAVHEFFGSFTPEDAIRLAA